MCILLWYPRLVLVHHPAEEEPKKWKPHIFHNLGNLSDRRLKIVAMKKIFVEVFVNKWSNYILPELSLSESMFVFLSLIILNILQPKHIYPKKASVFPFTPSFLFGLFSHVPVFPLFFLVTRVPRGHLCNPNAKLFGVWPPTDTTTPRGLSNSAMSMTFSWLNLWDKKNQGNDVCDILEKLPTL